VSVELKVTLVGEDPQQQQAFNNPNPAPASSTSAPPQTMPEQAATKPTLHFPKIEHRPLTEEQKQARQQSQSQPQPVQQPTTSPTAPASQSQTVPSIQPPLVQGFDVRLINSLDQLIQAIDELAALQAAAPSQSSSVSHQSRSHGHKTETWFDRFAGTIDKKIDDLGMAQTAIGDLISGLTHTFAGVGTRATKFASNLFTTGATSAAARTAATGAATSAAGASTAAGGATAAAGTGASAGAAGALAASGPLIAVALAAGAAALSVKKFMDAVEHTAAQLEDLSPDIAAGRAQHQVSMELARLDRAKRIGSDVANLDHAQHRLSESMYELQTKIYELILKASPGIEFGIDLLNAMVRALDVLIATGNDITAKITPDPTDDAPAAKALSKSMREWSEALKELTHSHQGGMVMQIDPLLQELLSPNPGKPTPKAPHRGNAMP